MSTFEVEYSNERILPNSGMALVGAILEQSGFRETLNQLDVTDKRSERVHRALLYGQAGLRGGSRDGRRPGIL